VLLRRRRLALELTQEALAERANVSVRSISEMERGRSPRPHTVDALAAALELIGAERDHFVEAGRAQFWQSRAGRPERRLSQTNPRPAQLPAAGGGFTGRMDELRQLDELADSARIVAIVGQAGVGKTSLALSWAQQNRQHFPDGQLFLNLRGFDPTGQAVPPPDALRILLGGLGVQPQHLPSDLDDRAALCRSLLAERRVLLLLDNGRDADHVRPLLPGGPGCLVLVTSRDQLWSLVAVEGARSLPLAPLSDQHALDLLAHRLGTQQVFADPDATREVIRICAALPLALTIAAAVAASSCETSLRPLAAELGRADGSLDVLAGWDLASDIRAAFACSYDKLSRPASELFGLLGLHPGADFSIAAAASLTGITIEQVRAPVAELVQANLLDEVSPARFVLHDLLRAYARELVLRCQTRPQQQSAQIRLLDHYLHGAHTAGALLNPNLSQVELAPPSAGVCLSTMDDAQQALAWFTAERDSLLAAVGLAGAVGSDRHVWQIGCSIAAFLTNRGHWRQWVEVLTTALEAAQRLDDDIAMAHTHRHLGVALAVRGEGASARAHYLRALDLFAELNDDRGQALTYRNLAWMSEQDGEDLDSLSLNKKAFDLYQRAGDTGGQARALNVIGWDYARLGDFLKSQTYCLQAIPLLQAAGDTHGEANTCDSLGYAYHHLGDYERAIVYFKRALDLLAPAGDRYNEAEVHLHLADAMAQVDDSGAEQHRRRALEILDYLGHPRAHEIRRRGEAGATSSGGA